MALVFDEAFWRIVSEDFRQFQQRRDATMAHGRDEKSEHYRPGDSINSGDSKYLNAKHVAMTYRGQDVAPGHAVGMLIDEMKDAMPIKKEMLSLEFQIDRLHSVVAILKSRLDPILGPPGPANAGASPGCGVTERHSSLAESIGTRVESLSNACDAIDELLDRIEL